MDTCDPRRPSDSVVVEVDRLLRLVFQIFKAAGCAPDEARAVSEGLVDASCAGHHSHGVVRVMRYLDWMGEGKLKPNQVPTIEVDAGAIAVVDGHQGFGQTVAPFAVDVGIEKARKLGVAVIGVKRSGHLGRLGDWAERAAVAELCSIHFANVNGHVLVAPFGGTQRRFSTAPFSIGIPRVGLDPVVVDFATSTVAEGKVLMAARGGKPVPDDALIMPDGSVSGDPSVLYGDTPDGQLPHPRRGTGAIRAFGEHKGSGLAFMCEVLAGLLTGSGTTGVNPKEGRLWSGMLGIYIDPTRFGEGEALSRSLSDFVDYVHETRPADVNAGVLVPGEVETNMRRVAHLNGVSLPLPVWADLQRMAGRFGVTC
ncbi:putative oxidoreductase [Bradyrhizobium algeriense]|uniref:Oxidoreductase n=1 Tax=Bradyrhizobium algeriense TaxID=634784 RepID=A0ABU8BHK4_9BRAD